MPFATIDIGTNTAQLLVVEVQGSTLRRLHAAERFVRLGEGVDQTGEIGGPAQDRLMTALQDHVTTAKEAGASRIVVTGTSALRDAANRKRVCDRIQRELGLRVEILSGDAEASWSFAAACSAFPDLSGPCLVVDVGGGSTELISGTNPQKHHPLYPEAMTGRVSMNVGCVRLTERDFERHPPDAEAIAQVVAVIDDALTNTSLPVGPNATVIGTAGTATALALVHLGPEATWDALHGAGFTLSLADIKTWRERLVRRTVDEIRTLHPSAMDGRADVFTVGVILLEQVLDHYNHDELRVSPYELRHGLALRELASPPSTGTSP